MDDRNRPPSLTNRPVARFLISLFEMVDEAATNDVVSWSADGGRFIIKDCERLEQEVLGRYFRTSRFSSLCRQLNFYSFRRHTELDTEFSHWTSFEHPFFVRGGYDQLGKVVRRTNTSAQRALRACGEDASADADASDIDEEISRPRGGTGLQDSSDRPALSRLRPRHMLRSSFASQSAGVTPSSSRHRQPSLSTWPSSLPMANSGSSGMPPAVLAMPEFASSSLSWTTQGVQQGLAIGNRSSHGQMSSTMDSTFWRVAPAGMPYEAPYQRDAPPGFMLHQHGQPFRDTQGRMEQPPPPLPPPDWPPPADMTAARFTTTAAALPHHQLMSRAMVPSSLYQHANASASHGGSGSHLPSTHGDILMTTGNSSSSSSSIALARFPGEEIASEPHGPSRTASPTTVPPRIDADSSSFLIASPSAPTRRFDGDILPMASSSSTMQPPDYAAASGISVSMGWGASSIDQLSWSDANDLLPGGTVATLPGDSSREATGHGDPSAALPAAPHHGSVAESVNADPTNLPSFGSLDSANSYLLQAQHPTTDAELIQAIADSNTSEGLPNNQTMTLHSSTQTSTSDFALGLSQPEGVTDDAPRWLAPSQVLTAVTSADPVVAAETASHLPSSSISEASRPSETEINITRVVPQATLVLEPFTAITVDTPGGLGVRDHEVALASAAAASGNDSHQGITTRADDASSSNVGSVGRISHGHAASQSSVQAAENDFPVSDDDEDGDEDLGELGPGNDLLAGDSRSRASKRSRIGPSESAPCTSLDRAATAADDDILELHPSKLLRGSEIPTPAGDAREAQFGDMSADGTASSTSASQVASAIRVVPVPSPAHMGQDGMPLTVRERDALGIGPSPAAVAAAAVGASVVEEQCSSANLPITIQTPHGQTIISVPIQIQTTTIRSSSSENAEAVASVAADAMREIGAVFVQTSHTVQPSHGSPRGATSASILSQSLAHSSPDSGAVDPSPPLTSENSAPAEALANALFRSVATQPEQPTTGPRASGVDADSNLASSDSGPAPSDDGPRDEASIWRRTALLLAQQVLHADGSLSGILPAPGPPDV